MDVSQVQTDKGVCQLKKLRVSVCPCVYPCVCLPAHLMLSVCISGCRFLPSPPLSGFLTCLHLIISSLTSPATLDPIILSAVLVVCCLILSFMLNSSFCVLGSLVCACQQPCSSITWCSPANPLSPGKLSASSLQSPVSSQPWTPSQPPFSQTLVSNKTLKLLPGILLENPLVAKKYYKAKEVLLLLSNNQFLK